MFSSSGFVILMGLSTFKFLFNFKKGVNLMKSLLTLTHTIGLASCVFGTNYLCQKAKNEVDKNILVRI